MDKRTSMAIGMWLCREDHDTLGDLGRIVGEVADIVWEYDGVIFEKARDGRYLVDQEWLEKIAHAGDRMAVIDALLNHKEYISEMYLECQRKASEG